MNEQSQNRPSPFDYLDYRKFLRDYYECAKKSRSGFSFRAFSQKAGFGSSNFYKLVMDGDRNLTKDSIQKFAKTLKLNKQETEFFSLLVQFNQAKSHEEKDKHYQTLLQSRKFKQLKPIEKDKYQYYSAWYHPIVRELITSKDFNGSLHWLAEKIYPQLPVEKIEKSIQLLEKLGLIQKDKKGQYKQTETLLTTGDEAAAVITIKYHHNMLRLTEYQLTKVPAQHRDISSMTLGVSKDKIPELKKKIQEFRKEILKMVSTETEAEEVAVLNMQFLPVTKFWGE